MAQMRIFLSHSSADRDFADSLAKALRNAGADVWYDETHLGTGQLLREISRQIANRPVFIVILSKAAFASEWVPRESEWAYHLYAAEPHRVILPVVAEPIDTFDWYEMLWIEGFRRVEAPGGKPFPQSEAITHVLRLLALAPAGESSAPTAPQQNESAKDYIERGKALFGQARYNEALTEFEQAIALAPQLAQAWANKGATLSRLQRFADGLTACEQAIKFNPTYAYAWHGKGNAFYGLQRYDEALSAYEYAIKFDSKYLPATKNKARTLRKLGRNAEAEQVEKEVKDLGG